MKAFIASVDGKIIPVVHTSLSKLCENIGVSYGPASRGKRVFEIASGAVVIITEVEVQKIVGRGGLRAKGL